MVCCKCNRTGLCRGCACVKARRLCESCLPSKLGNCANTSTAISQVTAPLDPSSLSTAMTHSTSSTTQLTTISTSRDPSVSSHSNQQIAQTSHQDHPLQTVPTTSTADIPDGGSSHSLPGYTTMSEPTFVWGDRASAPFMKDLDAAFEQAVQWRNNCFKVPQGSAGEPFVKELSRLFNAFARESALEPVALKATIVLPLLLLQKPHRRSKAKEHTQCLERRLKLWMEGALDDLVREGKSIQDRLPRCDSKREEEHLSRSFATLMFQGKTQAALQLLSNKGKGGLLRLGNTTDADDPYSLTVKEVLKEKHPPAAPSTPGSLINGIPPDLHPVIFDSIDSSLIRSCALITRGAGGPSSLDALTWRRLCTSFKTASNDLCQSLAATAKRLCTTFVDPKSVAPLLSCRLIAISKNPGVRPIGIAETTRRIIAKAVLRITGGDIQDATGSVQLAGGQIAGVEAAIHAVREKFLQDETEAALLVDASNAFNSLNRNTSLHNIRFLCPALSTILINSYRAPTELFIDGEVLLSQEGTTQGDPLAMPMYALATILLIKSLPESVSQVWYADDATALGTVSQLRVWWDDLAEKGPSFGYHANPLKTWLVTKASCHSDAVAAFAGTNVNVSQDGRPHLGAALGTPDYSNHFVAEKVNTWSGELKLLSAIAKTQPHAAYAALTHGLSSRWAFLSRTMPNISNHLQQLEGIIRTILIPSLTARPPPSDIERDLLALPARLGGLGLWDPSRRCDSEFAASWKITTPLVELIGLQSYDYTFECLEAQMIAKCDIKKQRDTLACESASALKGKLSPSTLKAMELASERGASNWLTSLPIEEFGFSLHKGAFVDALALRYGHRRRNRGGTGGLCPPNFYVSATPT